MMFINNWQRRYLDKISRRNLNVAQTRKAFFHFMLPKRPMPVLKKDEANNSKGD